MDKRIILLDAVKKLLALEVPEEEIILNLAEVGVSTEQARELIREARSRPIEGEEKEKVESESGRVLMDVAQTLAETRKEEEESGKDEGEKIDEKEVENMLRGFGSEYEKDEEEKSGGVERRRYGGDNSPLIIERRIKPKKKKEEKKAEREAEKAVQAQRSVNIEKLWEQGILTTVNQKVNEMKEIRDSLDAKLEEKVRLALNSELEKIHVSFEAQRDLMISQMQETLDKKFKEATYFIDHKIVEIKSSKNEIAEMKKMVEEERKKHQQFMKEYETKMLELTEAKDSIVSEMNAELIKAKSSYESVTEDAEEKLKSIDDRVNKALELESNIAEGLVASAQDRIDELVEEKLSEIRAEVQKTVQGLSRTREELEKSQKQKLDAMEKEKEEKLREMLDAETANLRQFRLVFEKQLSDRLEKLDELYALLEREIKKSKEERGF